MLDILVVGCSTSMTVPEREKVSEFLSYSIPGGKTGVLLIHGFSGHNAELKELAEYLGERGYAVSVPMLAGHGTHPDELLETTPYDWIDTAAKSLVKLGDETEKIYVVGVSLGANIAFKLARLFAVDGVVSLGGVVEFFQHKALTTFLPVVAPFRKYHVKRVMKSHFVEEAAITRRKAYPVVPLKTLHLVTKFIEEETKRDLPCVKVPTLIMHSKTDRTVKPESAEYIYRNLGSADKELVFIPRSHHNLLIDAPRFEVFERIHTFVAGDGRSPGNGKV